MPRYVTESRTAAIIVEGFSCRNGKIVERQTCGVRGARDDDDVAEREDGGVLPPCVKFRERVPPEREDDAAARPDLGSERAERLDGIGPAAARDLDGPGAEAPVPGDRAPYHVQ